MENDNALIGQADAGVGGGNGLVVPFGDLAKVNAGNDFRGELQLCLDLGHVICRYY